MAQNISLVRFKIQRFDFHFLNDAKDGMHFQINPQIECKIGKNGKKLNAFITAKVNEQTSNPVPFDMHVVLVGEFAVVNEVTNGEYVKDAFEILYPFLRSSVAGAMANFNVPPYFLPVINVKELSNEGNANGDLN